MASFRYRWERIRRNALSRRRWILILKWKLSAGTGSPIHSRNLHRCIPDTRPEVVLSCPSAFLYLCQDLSIRWLWLMSFAEAYSEAYTETRSSSSSGSSGSSSSSSSSSRRRYRYRIQIIKSRRGFRDVRDYMQRDARCWQRVGVPEALQLPSPLCCSNEFGQLGETMLTQGLPVFRKNLQVRTLPRCWVRFMTCGQRCIGRSPAGRKLCATKQRKLRRSILLSAWSLQALSLQAIDAQPVA